MLAHQLNGTRDVLYLMTQRLHDTYSTADAEAFIKALETRQPHKLKALNIQATSVFERGDVRVYRLTRDFNTIFVRVEACGQARVLLRWHETQEPLLH